MKKLINDLAYILFALALVFGVVRFALPSIDVSVSSAPLVPKPTPIPAYIATIEQLADGLDVPLEHKVLVLFFWSPDCKYCIEQIMALEDIVTSRPDVLVLGLTTEMDEAVIESVIIDTGISFFTFYGLPKFPIESVPNMHVLLRENGTWKLAEGGTWIGFTSVDVIIRFIDEAGMNDNYKRPPDSGDNYAGGD